MTSQTILAGFGGQGILFAGKFLAYTGLVQDRHVSWLPSYGPEMRGGTCNCNVIISDDPVGSPIISQPDVLMVMNIPSLDKYEDTVAPGGIIICDSTLIEREVKRTDVTAVYVPATRLANENDIAALANMIIIGKLLDTLGAWDDDTVVKALQKTVPASKPQMFEANKKALTIGREFK